jgi:hypothetical protein
MSWALRGVIIRSQPKKPSAAKRQKALAKIFRERTLSNNKVTSDNGKNKTLMLFLVTRHLSLVTFAIGALALARTEAADLRVGSNYQLAFTDVDHERFSMSDGHVSIISVVTRENESKAQALGDRVPRQYYGDPKFRLITIVNFQQGIFAPLRGVVTAVIRHRLDAEAKNLQKVYSERKVRRKARDDIYVVADFDGKAVSQLGIAPKSSEFAVFVFDGRGRLVRRWSDVPSAEALTEALQEAR